MAVVGRIQPTVRRVASSTKTIVSVPNARSMVSGVAARYTKRSKSMIGHAKATTDKASNVQSTRVTRCRDADEKGYVRNVSASATIKKVTRYT